MVGVLPVIEVFDRTTALDSGVRRTDELWAFEVYFYRNFPWPRQDRIESHENGPGAARRPPDKGGWGVTCFPRAGLAPAL